ncbi:MAG: DUF378 domain-containing protein [Candidatus Staskawiczbacteria bacterium RIFCSPHIGHO2_02_FULL_34_9]|uniref:DUF378 domain-containing protein n=1 Tax=Candidatus Staskawiczbacteria bacterium RIFCSPHIGHO2_02_FULL_34_9 TaxID=1802206 RepID=A0A1G2I3G9_9BACT|nr:MAG: DUF378 domain-containing protein [Candidatus Staskawiczbacteria bacterium RIFCSPHIGHO2_02_FULL_34_9]
MKFSTLDWVTLILVVVGGLNWGLVGAFDFNLVDSIFGMMSMLSRIIYVLVGLSAIYMIWMALSKKDMNM